MKKLIFSIAALVALTTTSCKKAYECTCTSSEASNSYAAVLQDPAYVTYAANANQAEANDESTPETTTTTHTLDKTTKADVNAECKSTETVSTSTPFGGNDYNDYDNDGNTDEAGVLQTSTTKTECEIEKTK